MTRVSRNGSMTRSGPSSSRSGYYDEPETYDTRREQPSAKTLNRRPLEAPKPLHQPNNEPLFKTSRINQRELDSSCYRLSRVPQKFALSKPDTTTSYAAQYYQNNPNAQIDTTPPKEKLENIQKRLTENGDDVDNDERFDLLVQQKTLAFLVYGENSVEAAKALNDIAQYYNDQGHSSGAQRHSQKSKQISRSYIENAENVIKNYKSIPKADQENKVNEAEKNIKQLLDVKIDDKSLVFRRSFVYAELLYKQKNYEECLKYYDQSNTDLVDANKGEETEQNAQIYLTKAQICKEMKENDKMKDEVKKAMEIYDKLKMEENVDSLSKEYKIEKPQFKEEDAEETKENESIPNEESNEKSQIDQEIASHKEEEETVHENAE